MTFEQACKIANNYFEEQVGLYGLAAASEDEEYWYFSGGKGRQNAIGNIFISVNKNDGKINKVNMLSKEGYKQIASSEKKELPPQFTLQA